MKRIFFWLAGGILALVLVLSIGYAFRQQLIAPYLESRLIAELESRYGVRVAIGEIGGTFVTTLELAGVETVGSTPDRPVTRISLHRGEARYWLPDLVGGFGNLVRQADIVLEGARIEVDLDRPGLEAEAEQPAEIPSPADLPDLRVRNSFFLLQGRGFHVELAGLAGDLQAPETAGAAPVRLDLQAAAATLAHPRLKKQTGPLTAQLAYDGEQLHLQELRCAGQPLVHQADLDLRGREEGVFGLRAALRLFGGDADLQLLFAENGVAGRTRIDAIDLHALSAALAIPGLPPLTGTLNGTAELRADTRQVAETLGGEIDLRVDEGGLRQVAADSLRLQATARHGEILIRHFAGRIGANLLAVEGVGFPAPALVKRQWARLLAAAPGTFSLQFEDIPGLLAMAGLQPERLPERIPAHRLELQGRVGNRSLDVAHGLLRTATGSITVRTARLDLPPQDAAWADTAVAAGLALDLPQLAEVGAIFGLNGLKGSLAGDLDLDGTFGAPAGRATVAGKNLAFRGTPLGDLQLAAVADRRSVQVKTLTMERAHDFIRGHGTLRLDPRRLEGLALDFSLAAIEQYKELLPFDMQVAGRLTGNLTAEGPVDAPTVALRATLDKGNIDGHAVASAKVALQSQGRTITLEKAEAETGHGTVALAGTVERGPENRQFTARLHSLRLTTPAGGDLQLVEPATLSYALAGALGAENLTLRGNIGEIKLDGRLGRQTTSALRVRLTDLTSRYWLSQLVGEKVSFSDLDAELTFTGTLEKPALRTSGQAAAIRLPEVPFPISGGFDLDFDDKGLTVRRLELTGVDDLEISLSGSLPLNPWRDDIFLPGELSLAGRVAMPSLELLEAMIGNDLELGGRLGGDLRVTGSWADPEGHLQLHGWGLRIGHPDLPAPPNPLDLTADVTVRGDTLRLRALRLTSPDVDFTATGQWTEGPSVQNILRGGGLQLAGNLDFQGKLDLPAIGWLAGGIEPVRRLAGSLVADLAVAGPARDPKMNGTLRVAGGELRTTLAIPPIENFNLTAALAGRRLIVQHSRGELGSAPFSLGGSLTREQGKVLFDLDLKGNNLLLYRNDWMMIRADSDLDITGPVEQLAVSGKMAVTDGYYQRNVDFLNVLRGSNRPKPVEGLQLFSIRSGPLRGMTFAVEIRTKNPFRVENNLTRARVRPELTLAGTGELPVLLGRIYVDESTIRLPTTRLRVQSGLVQFPKDRPNRPSIDLLAETKMAGYDINMQIEGTYSEPVVTLSSVPPLPHDDLLLLLLAGRLPQEGADQQTAQAGGVNIAMYVGRGLLADWFRSDSPEEDEESLIERLQVEVGRGITRKGQETLEARLELAEDLLKKEDVLYLTAERDVYDEFNIGVKIVFRFK